MDRRHFCNRRRPQRAGGGVAAVGTDGHDAQAVKFDRDLGGTENVAGRVEGHLDATQRDGLTIADRLRRPSEVVAVAQPHQVECFLGGQHRTVAGTRMIGMTVGDHGLVHRTGGVDMKAAVLAAHAGGRREKDVFGAHLP